MAYIVGYIGIGLFALVGVVAVYGIIDIMIQLYKQNKTNNKW
jgi:hypothetical protein